MRQSLQECSATLSWRPSEVHAVRVTSFRRSALRRNARIPARGSSAMVPYFSRSRRPFLRMRFR